MSQMHPISHAQSRPDHPAVIMANSGETMTFGEMEAFANRFAHVLRAHGLGPDDAVALVLENRIEYLPLNWGSQRAGTVVVPVSTHLTAPEVAYILKDSGAKLLITSTRFAGLLEDLESEHSGTEILVFDEEGPRNAQAALEAQPVEPIADQQAGYDMMYSSGTTGRPKGIRPAAPQDPDPQAVTPLLMLMTGGFGIPADGSCVYLSPGPLYHAAPLRWSMIVHRVGGTVVVMEKFDAENALAAIEKYKVNSSQWVPTHFVRMLKLPEEVRGKYDLSSHERAIHAAAPCPVDVKRAMIEWWGPIVLEYYAGTEGNGMTMVDSATWMEKPGTVGKPIFGELHICDENGDDVPTGEEGGVYFLAPMPFEYHNDPEKTAEATNARGHTTLGDVGRVDEDGYLFLTDRRSNLILSGGVNIYPQEVENLIITHPKVKDAAVVGAPDEDMGERVVAVVQPIDINDAGEALEAQLLDFLSGKLARLKMPRQFDFREELPREANGKLYKRKLKEEFKQRAAAEA